MLFFTCQAWKKGPVNSEHNDGFIFKFKPLQVVMIFFDTQVNLVTAM